MFSLGRNAKRLLGLRAQPPVNGWQQKPGGMLLEHGRTKASAKLKLLKGGS